MWTTFNFFIGSWQGSGQGKAGDSRVERKYEFVLNRKFIFVQSKSTYDPQENNPKRYTKNGALLAMIALEKPMSFVNSTLKAL